MPHRTAEGRDQRKLKLLICMCKYREHPIADPHLRKVAARGGEEIPRTPPPPQLPPFYSKSGPASCPRSEGLSHISMNRANDVAPSRSPARSTVSIGAR